MHYSAHLYGIERNDLHYTTQVPRPRRPSELLERVGLAVRAARRGHRLSRRSLAARSGVSERFLAQLESGRGNISLLRLEDLARALGTPLPGLLGPAPAGRGPRVALIGLRGAGKSTVGRLLARRLKAPFIELDYLIEKAAGMPIGPIFELHGERYFRRIEREVLQQLISAGGPAVVATGGGLVTDPETYALLRSSFLTVHLSADPGDHYARVLAQGDRRPMRGSPDAMQELRALLAARRPLYALADLTLDTSRLAAGEAAMAIARRLTRPRRKPSSAPA